MSKTQIAEIVNRAGGVTAVSKKIGRPIGTISAWMTRNKVPAESARDFAAAVEVPVHEIRPDIFPAAEVA